MKKRSKGKVIIIFIIIIAMLTALFAGFGLAVDTEVVDEGGIGTENPTETLDAKDLEPKPKIEPEPEVVEEVLPVIFKDEEKQKKAEELAQKEPKFKEFMMGYPDNDGKAHGGFTKEEIEAEHPHFLQYDVRWGYVPFGSGRMAGSGCGPTALAMVVLELTGNTQATPDKIAEYATENGYYTEGAGIAWSLFQEGAKEYGVIGSILPLSKENIINELEAGHPIIISLRPGDFTERGHIAVIVDYKDDMFRVNDPGSTINTEKLWDFERIAPQIKQLWTFTTI